MRGTLKFEIQSSVPVPPFAPFFHPPPPYLLSSVPLHPFIPSPKVSFSVPFRCVRPFR